MAPSNKNLLFGVWIFSFVVFWGNSSSYSADNKLEREALADNLMQETLRGLGGVDVVVEVAAGDDGKEIGLTESQIQTDVELRLRKNRIKVFSEEESYKQRDLYATLRVYITLLKLKGDPYYFYHIKCELFQAVSLARKPRMKLRTPTWWSGIFGYADSSRFPNKIRESTGDVVDVFSNAYLATNPK